MNRKRQTAVEKIALTTLQKSGFHAPGFSVKEVVKKLGVEVKPHDFGDELISVLIRQNGRGVIGFNPTFPRSLVRFSIAHSLGHYVLGSRFSDNVIVEKPENFYTILDISKKDVSTPIWNIEREANAFAAALLMPEPMIDTLITQLKEQLDVRDEKVDFIAEMAKAFKVSYQLMCFRLSTFGWLW